MRWKYVQIYIESTIYIYIYTLYTTENLRQRKEIGKMEDFYFCFHSHFFAVRWFTREFYAQVEGKNLRSAANISDY
jgi:hypothetical protein